MTGELADSAAARRFTVSLQPDDHTELAGLALRLRVSRSEALRRAIRDRLAETPEPDAANDTSMAEELALHNLVATEQVIRLLERFLPGGTAASAEVLPAAIGAAQVRIASGSVPG